LSIRDECIGRGDKTFVGCRNFLALVALGSWSV